MYRQPYTPSSTMLRKKIINDNKIKFKGDFEPSEEYALLTNLIGHCKFASMPINLRPKTLHTHKHSRQEIKELYSSTLLIHNFTKKSHPDIWEKVKKNKIFITNIKLFSFIPFLKIIKKNNHKQVLLFNIFPILSCYIKL